MKTAAGFHVVARHHAGFTLLELMVVLVIAILALSAVPPLFSNVLPGLYLKGTTRDLAAAMRYARGWAVNHGEEATVRLDLERRLYTVTGRARKFELPEELRFKLYTARSEVAADGSGAIRFFPDGGATGGRVTVAFERRCHHVEVEWLTGRVHVETPDQCSA